jgi:ElaB/YqjD/DUF883 family membrane-anchored ribosome-binding protein
MFASNARSTRNVAAEVANLRNDLGRLAEAVAAMVSTETSRGRSTMRDDASGIGTTLSDLIGQARDTIANRASDLTHGDKMGDMADTLCSANARIEHRIERNPKSSVLVAAAIGLAIGLVSRR